jgi:paraquat-inducible protein A
MSPVIVCRHCDLAHRGTEAPDRGRTQCARCGAPLQRAAGASIDTAIALAACALVLLFLSNAYPLVEMHVNGSTRETTLIGAALGLYAQNFDSLAALVFLTTVIAPLVQITVSLYLLLPLRRKRRAPGQETAFRLLTRIRRWSFTEVFLLGRSLGLLVCLECRATVRAVPAAHLRCPRCHAAVHARKPYSLLLTTVFIIAAAILYVPANLLPVMDSRTLIDDEYDTIMSGVLVLLRSGSWPIALLVFFASIVVPLLKILALAVLVYSAWARWPRQRLQRSELYRMVEFIGRWSMLDIYAISLLATLVQVQSFALVIVGWGAWAFGAVVVLTLLASRTFDERLLWDHSE